MLNQKFIVVITSIVVAIFALCNIDFMTTPIVENWWGGIQLSTTEVPYLQTSRKVSSNGQPLKEQDRVALPGNSVIDPNMMGSGKFVSVPSYQSVLSPRFSNVNYGANIKYNLPDRENLGSPCDPLTFGDMAKENYESNPPSCGKGGYGFGNKVAGGYELSSGYENGNKQEVLSQNSGSQIVGSDLPIGTMSSMDGAGNMDQVVMYGRLMVSTSKSSSKLRSQGDPIRGDLPIVPCQSGWFSVYPTISRDLQEGAMNVLTDVAPGSSYNNLMNMLVTSTGGAQNTFGGAVLSQLPSQQVNMAGSSETGLSAGMGDIQVTSFP